MELLHRLQHLQQFLQRNALPPREIKTIANRISTFVTSIKSLGFNSTLDDYERRKLGIFNLLNFFQLLTGIFIPLACLVAVPNLHATAWLVAGLPALVSLAVLILNGRQKQKTALYLYFILYPVFTAIIYINGINLGIELFFVLYGILSVFFLQDIGYMIFSVALSMVSYFVLSIVLQQYQYQLKSLNIYAYLFNQALAIGYIFYGLYLIKNENTEYQSSINDQRTEMTEQSELLKIQAGELKELNTLNNKLFSVISHDLKTPMYALRNLFHNAKELKMSARELKSMLPDVINDLNYTTGLMENLLHWAKSQMQSNKVCPRELDMNALIEDNMNLLRIQADAKKISMVKKTENVTHVWADRDMINLVLRNLLSNAIKFTPANGVIVLGTHQYEDFVEVYVTDSGIGIPQESMQKINANNFYTTTGTDSEAGTGLGLMLCKEFLGRNNGNMMIESAPGKGSTFSFTLPPAPREFTLEEIEEGAAEKD
jgi:signal transduction histidine kinase